MGKKEGSMIRKDKDRTPTGEALNQYFRKHKNIQLLAETLMKINKIDPRNKSKPLSEEEIDKLYKEYGDTEWGWQIAFARAIEERGKA